MEVRTESRRGWRRALVALAIVATPVISVAGFSGSVSAGASPTFDANHSAVQNCSGAGGPGVTITIVKDANAARYSVSFNGTLEQSGLNPPNGGSQSWHYPKADGTYTVSINRTDGSNTDSWSGPVTVDCEADPEDAFSAVASCEAGVPGITVTVPDVKPGNGPRNDIYVDSILTETAVADGTPVFIPLSAGSYDILVKVGSTDVGTTQEITVSAYICIGEPEDGTINEICSGDMAPGLNINIPDVKPGNGPKYTLYISADGEDVDYNNDESDSNFGDGYDVDYATGEGTFHIIVVGPADDELYNDYFTVDCSNGGGGNGGWTINLNLLKPAIIPTTGSDTDTLLVLAPIMVLLGAGMILARRRFATV
jgi:LPXTG-motif cell wall-anchored protein